MMKKIFVVIALMAAVMCRAQDITVESFKLVENDLTANTAGTMVLDQNGEKCALIKVATSQTDFTFDVGMMGVVKTVQKESEIWVYVPAGVKRISISHVGMDALRDWDLGMSVQKACTYLLMLKTKKDVAMQMVTFKVTPTSAVIIIESSDANEKQSLSLSNGTASMQLPVGDYKYIATAPGYMVEEGNFKLLASSSRKVVLELSEQPVSNEGDVEIKVVNTPTSISEPSLVIELPNPILGVNIPSTPPNYLSFLVNGVAFKMIEVEGGSFIMGATSEQGADISSNEMPPHRVTLSTYYVGETEVTQELWKAVMGKNPSSFKGLQNPVETISWDDCQIFISKLNAMSGRNFRLLTEAEWEYAARGGSRSKGYKYSGSDDVSSVAWYDANGGKETHPVKGKTPNELGIYDMSGNVWELCNDWFGEYQQKSVVDPAGPSGDVDHVNRGGSVCRGSTCCRVPFRDCVDSSYKSNILGFRLALSK